MVRADEEAACCPIYGGAWAWILNNIRQIKPAPVRGSLSIYICHLEIEDLEILKVVYLDMADRRLRPVADQGALRL